LSQGSNDDRRLVRVRTWREFKAQVIASRVDKLVYNIEQGLKPRNLTSLRLILPHEGVQYIFLDFAKDGQLKQTGIPLHVHRTGVQYISEEDVVRFLKQELKNPDLKVSSFWTM
jgi:hypothetical protein